MAATYKHLCIEERDRLAVLRGQELSLRAIGQALGRNVGTVSRELKRNAPPVHSCYYLAHKANGRAVARRQVAVRCKRLKDPKIRAYVARRNRSVEPFRTDFVM